MASMPTCFGQLPLMAQMALATFRAGVAAELWDRLVPEMDAIYAAAAIGDVDAAMERAGTVCEQLGIPRAQLQAYLARFLGCPPTAA